MAGAGANIPEQITPPPAQYMYTNNYGAEKTTNTNMSPYGTPIPKSVAFELLFPDSPHFRARLPMRVQIYPHDTTESIVTTVKNFYGLYAGPGGAKGVSFEDEHGHTLIARYENFRNNMIVYVRVIDEAPSSNDAYGAPSYGSASPVKAHDVYQSEMRNMPPPHPAQALTYGQPAPRRESEDSYKRNESPNGRGRRSVSSSANLPPNKKARSRSGYMSRGSSTHGSFADNHIDNTGYSSGDGAGSVSSRTKSEHLGNTEISLDNIVEGGRRKRAKFESSELPLFAPPQMPAATSNSSVSPARRVEHSRPSLPYPQPSHNPFAQAALLHSPQSYGNGFGQPGIYTTPVADGRYGGPRYSMGSTASGNTSGILPTPDPTIGSCMSEEDKDVALQLMRLGEMGNISHGRTSASTLDDTFSGRADAASSTGATSEEESDTDNELPPARRQKLEERPDILGGIRTFGKAQEFSSDQESYEDAQDGTFKPEHQSHTKIQETRILPPGMDKPRPKTQSTESKASKPVKSSRPAQAGKSKTKSATAPGALPASPTSMAAPHSRKTSVSSALNFQHQLGDDEEDLSSKPRCQRCRKSKKGCDRQRPCQRCKDAGLSADQCISEDEGNGRKGRYGRHMGVPVKKDEISKPILPLTTSWTVAPVADNAAAGKKRKR